MVSILDIVSSSLGKGSAGQISSYIPMEDSLPLMAPDVKLMGICLLICAQDDGGQNQVYNVDGQEIV